MTASTTGLQTGEHFALAQIQEATGSEFAPVHFSEGASQATTAFLGKHVDVLVANVSDVTDLTKQGKARVLGIMTAERSPVAAGRSHLQGIRLRRGSRHRPRLLRPGRAAGRRRQEARSRPAEGHRGSVPSRKR